MLALVMLVLIAIAKNCVNAKPPSRIVGGESVNIPDVPSTVMIRHRNSINATYAVICGGTIINPWYILTAAHCLETNTTDPQNPRHFSWYQVIAGKNSYRSNAKTYEIDKVYTHPNFSMNLLNDDDERGDVAVIKLKQRIPINRTHKPIELASTEPAMLAKGHIYGWGSTKPNTTAISRYLQGLLLIVFNRETCKDYYPLDEIAKDELCIVNPRRGSSCIGDSGGPVIVDGKLAGLISTGNLECTNVIPGSAVNVVYHKLWIEDIIKGTANITYSAETASGAAPNIQTSKTTKKKQGKADEREELSSSHLLDLQQTLYT